MKLVISLLLVLSILAATTVTGRVSNGQTPNAGPKGAESLKSKYKHKLPRNAVPGSTLERRAAWENLTQEQKQKLKAKIKANLDQAKLIGSKLEDPGEREELKPSLIDKQGNRKSETWRRQKKGDTPLLPIPASNEKATPPAQGAKASSPASKKETDQISKLRNHAGPSLFQSDADGDGFTEAFENQLADIFTPFYHISTNEPDHFARFGDFLPQTVIQTVSPYTPISHFRVTPLGFSPGNTLSYIRVDYWTLWDHDSGLDFDFFCQLNVNLGSSYLSGDIVFIIDLVIQMNSDHNLDNERSAILLAAPVANPSNPSFSTDPFAYSAHAFFLSAHETEPGDNSVILYPVTPIPATGPSHIELALARSKHATYTFDPFDPSYPDGLPLMPLSYIFAAYGIADALYFLGVICLAEYLALLYALDVSFFSCIVEHFGDSGGTFAPTRINIGELNQPLNASHFIQGGELFTKMNNAIPW